MMSPNIVQTLIITVVASVSLSANDAPKKVYKPLVLECPTMKSADLKTLAETGEIQLNGKSFRLVFEQDTSNNYNKRLIESQEGLATFLNKSNATLTVTRHINSHQNAIMKDHSQKYCPYILEKESEITVVAIAPTS